MKAQVTIEFTLLVSAVILLMLIMIASSNFNTSLARQKNEQEALDDLANYVQQEIVLASQMHSNYSQIFIIPTKIIGKQYSATILNYSLVVNTSKFTLNRGIPLVSVDHRTLVPGSFHSINKSEGDLSVYSL